MNEIYISNINPTYIETKTAVFIIGYFHFDLLFLLNVVPVNIYILAIIE